MTLKRQRQDLNSDLPEARALFFLCYKLPFQLSGKKPEDGEETKESQAGGQKTGERKHGSGQQTGLVEAERTHCCPPLFPGRVWRRRI